MESLWADEQAGARVVRLAEIEEVTALVRLFEGVARRERWQPEGALRLWADRSVYFGLEVGGQLAGGLQLVLPDVYGSLPCQSVWPDATVEAPTRSAHIAVMALEEAWRGRSALFWLLAAEMWRYCVGEGIGRLYLEVTPRVRPLYRRIGWPLEIVGERRRHWGEDCYLCALEVPDVTRELLLRSERSTGYRAVATQAFRLQELPGVYGADMDLPALRLAA